MVGLRYSKACVYESNHAILKKYTDNCYKVIFMKNCRQPGFEEQGKSTKGKRNSAGHSRKLDESLSRTRSKVYELAICNPWEYFVTLTLSPENGNRQNLRVFQRAFSKWINNLNYRHGLSIKYLLIPEPHKDGAWHMHGLFMGIPAEQLVPFSLHDYLPYRLRSLLRAGHNIFNWPAYADKFGWVTCERIRNFEACALYITKYITKELGENASRLNEKLYLCSHGLKRAETVCRGQLTQEFEPDFHNEYVAIKIFDNLEDAVSLFVHDNVHDSIPVSFVDLIDKISGGEPLRTLCTQI